MNHRIIDIHSHPNWHDTNIDGLVANMDEMGIEKGWLLAWELSKKEHDYYPSGYEMFDPRGLCIPLSLVVEGLQKYPDRFIGGWAIDPRDNYARRKLKAAVGIHGIKVYGELKLRMRYDDPDAIIMFRYCGELGLPVLFHLQYHPFMLDNLDKGPRDWPVWHGGDISVVDTMCRLCPDTKFIGHAQSFWSEISGGVAEIDNLYPTGPIKPGSRLVELLRKYDNLYCDTSAGSGCGALSRDLEFSKKFITEFQDRIMFGRDCFDRSHLDLLDKLDLPDDILKKIFHENAEKILA